MAKVNNTSDCSCWWEYGSKGTFLHCWWERSFIPSLWKSVSSSFGKMIINLPQDPAILLLGIYPKDTLFYHKDTWSTMFIAALSIMPRNWKQPRCSFNWRTDKENVVHYTMEYYSAVKIGIIKVASKVVKLGKNHLECIIPDSKTQILSFMYSFICKY